MRPRSKLAKLILRAQRGSQFFINQFQEAFTLLSDAKRAIEFKGAILKIKLGQNTPSNYYCNEAEKFAILLPFFCFKIVGSEEGALTTVEAEEVSNLNLLDFQRIEKPHLMWLDPGV